MSQRILGARTRLESSRYLNIDYLPEQQQHSYSMSDPVLSGAFTRPVLQTVYGSPQPPRTYGGRFTYRF
jgi:iron complex outermembrane recepter protein